MSPSRRHMKTFITRFLFLLIALVSCTWNAPAQQSKIRKIDFNNFTYPGIRESRSFTLKSGELEIEGKPCPHFKYTLGRVDYVDLDGDGGEEALVHIQDFTGCVSSSVHENYYIYGIRQNGLRLLWKFVSGAEGEAGLKDFRLEGRVLIFELFGKHRIVGAKPQSAGQNSGGDCCPASYSRIRVAWDGRAFRQRSVRFFPFPYPTIMDYFARKRGK